MIKPHQYKYNTKPAHIRFLSKFERMGNGCWIWKACVDKDGYGIFSANRQKISAHRYSYFLAHGELPVGKLVCHTCDTPSCVNPGHLFAGTFQENEDDCISKGRHSRGSGQHLAKLKESDIPRIKAMRASGMQFTQIAAEFGMSRTSIASAVRGETWKHVPNT